jgi:hypothetical protein
MRALQELGITVPRRVYHLEVTAETPQSQTIDCQAKEAEDNLDLPLVQDTKSAMAITLLVTSLQKQCFAERRYFLACTRLYWQPS